MCHSTALLNQDFLSSLAISLRYGDGRCLSVRQSPQTPSEAGEGGGGEAPSVPPVGADTDLTSPTDSTEGAAPNEEND